MRRPVEEQLTSKHEPHADEWYVPSEEIEHCGPIPRGAPDVLHFLRQDQQPIVELWVATVKYNRGNRDNLTHQDRHDRN